MLTFFSPKVIARLQRVHLVVDEISAKAKEVTRDPDPSAKLGEFTPYFDKLLMEYSGEYEKYRLDEIVVASVAPTVSFYLFYQSSWLTRYRCAVRWLNGSHCENPWRLRTSLGGGRKHSG